MHEIGFFVGGTNYVGDIGRSNYIYPTRVGGGMVYKHNYKPQLAFRFNYNYLPISAKDSDSNNAVRKARNIKFSNSINEFALGVEYNFSRYGMSPRSKKSTPYILVQVAGINYKKISAEQGVRNYIFANKTSYSIPFGLGYKAKLSYDLAFAVEARFTYMPNDDLDYTTKKIKSLNFGSTGNDWYNFIGFSIVYTFGRPPCYLEMM